MNSLFQRLIMPGLNTNKFVKLCTARGVIINLKRYLSVIVFLAMILFSIYYSVQYAMISPRPDFTAFYYAASVILDPDIPNTAIYDYNIMNGIGSKYGINQQIMPYIYSLPIAYLLSPLALMPYEISKIAWNLINLFLYLIAVAIVLRLGKATGRRFIYLMTLSLAWVPLILNQFWLQSNAVIFFLITLAAMTAVLNYPIICGLIIGIAVLFKLYPISIALIFGLKNWRIFIACIVLLGVSLLTPNSHKWLSVIHEIVFPKHITIFQLISQYLNFYWFVIYSLLISIITGLVTYRAKSADYCFLVGIAITAVFLIMPVVWVHYYTIFMFCYAYLFASANTLPRWLLIATFLSFGLVTFGAIFSPIIAEAGNIIIWMSMVIYLMISAVSLKHNTFK